MILLTVVIITYGAALAVFRILLQTEGAFAVTPSLSNLEFPAASNGYQVRGKLAVTLENTPNADIFYEDFSIQGGYMATDRTFEDIAAVDFPAGHIKRLTERQSLTADVESCKIDEEVPETL